LFAQGHAADLVIAVMLVEFVWLVTRGGWPAGAAVLRLAPGALMMIALRGAMTGVPWPWIALPLALAFPVHLADLRRRG
jgi:hypothetical protein